MQRTWILFLLALNLYACASAQNNDPTVFHNDRVKNRNTPTTIIPEWAPFYHGVASGDPLEDRVIIWTRVTPEDMDGTPIEVSWQVATDVNLENVVESGTFTTDESRDYTVKVDVTGLEAGTTYYYGFTAMGQNSLTGKTKTTPTDDQAEHLKFGVVSCSNYQAGYFNAYHRLADRTDLDAIIHLGDYIYEYADGVYGDSLLFEDRPLEPATEIVTLEEYRTRYSTYRLDTSLVRAHQQHPFIAVWDDHESANDAYTDGAQNHDEATQGDWETRKSVSKQVYFEWMPIRESDDQTIYRTLSYGNLMDLIMLDTRLEGRNIQIPDIQSPDFNDPDRTILGAEQKAWFFDQLTNSTAKWKVVGQQVIFADLHVGWAALIDPNASYYEVEGLFTDIWDGYPAERKEVITFIDENDIDNVVILTGDFHSSFGYDVADNPTDVTISDLPFLGEGPTYTESETYNPETGEGSVAVEFATPSITSANFDENTDLEQSLQLQAIINNVFEPIPNVLSLGNPNPHMKYVDLIQHGYYILDIKADSTQANWYYSDITQMTEEEEFSDAWYTKDGENHLQNAGGESDPKAVQDEPAPNDPPMGTNTADAELAFAVLAAYPNPASQWNNLHYSLTQAATVDIRLFDASGKQLQTLLNDRMTAGIFSLRVDVSDLPDGTYFYRIQVDQDIKNVKIVVTK